MTAGPTSNMDVKRRNRSNTLRCILTCDRISQMELSQRLSLSWPTVLQNVKELTELGLIQEVGSYESTGGRKAKAYAPVRDARLALGLDITRNHVSVVLMDLSGRMVRSIRKTCPFSLDDGYAQGLGELAGQFVEENGAQNRNQSAKTAQFIAAQPFSIRLPFEFHHYFHQPFRPVWPCCHAGCLDPGGCRYWPWSGCPRGPSAPWPR